MTWSDLFAELKWRKSSENMYQIMASISNFNKSSEENIKLHSKVHYKKLQLSTKYT